MTEETQANGQQPRTIQGNVKIISDGTAQGTMVFINNQQLQRVFSLEIAPILPGQPVVAKIGVFVDQLNIDDPEVQLDPRVPGQMNGSGNEVQEAATNGPQ